VPLRSLRISHKLSRDGFRIPVVRGLHLLHLGRGENIYCSESFEAVPAHPSDKIVWRQVWDFRICRNKGDGKWSMQSKRTGVHLVWIFNLIGLFILRTAFWGYFDAENKFLL